MPGMIQRAARYAAAPREHQAAIDFCEAMEEWNEVDQTPTDERDGKDVDVYWQAAMVLLLRWRQLTDG